MKGFKQYLYNELRHLHMDQSIPLRITQPVDGQFQTKTIDVGWFDMKFEFYTVAMKLAGSKWIQTFPSSVATKPGMILVNEGYYTQPGGNFYVAHVDTQLLQKALSEKKAFVDTKKQTLVEEMGDPKVVIECEVNPLDQFHIPSDSVVDKKHGISVLRQGWESKNMLDWWDFVECTDASGGYAKRSCHLDAYEIGDLLKSKGIE